MSDIPTWFYPRERMLEQCENDRERARTEDDDNNEDN